MFTKKHRTSHTDWTDKEVNLTSLWTYTDQLRGQTQRFQPDATCVTLSWMVHSSPMDSISHELSENYSIYNTYKNYTEYVVYYSLNSTIKLK